MLARNDWEVMKLLHGQADVHKRPQPTVERFTVMCPRCGKKAAKYPAEFRISCGTCGNLRILNR